LICSRSLFRVPLPPARHGTGQPCPGSRWSSFVCERHAANKVASANAVPSPVHGFHDCLQQGDAIHGPWELAVWSNITLL
jgi:hypothetical protein